MYTPFLLVHGDNSPPSLQCGREVNMAHLCQGVSYGIVNRTLADLPTFDVRNGNTQCQRDSSRSEHFVPVGNQKKDIGTHLAETIRKTDRSHPNGFGHANV